MTDHVTSGAMIYLEVIIKGDIKGGVADTDDDVMSRSRYHMWLCVDKSLLIYKQKKCELMGAGGKHSWSPNLEMILFMPIYQAERLRYQSTPKLYLNNFTEGWGQSWHKNQYAKAVQKQLHVLFPVALIRWVWIPVSCHPISRLWSILTQKPVPFQWVHPANKVSSALSPPLTAIHPFSKPN